MWLILVIVLLLLVGGGGFHGYSTGWTGGPLYTGGIGLGGILLIILVVLLLTGRL